MVARSRTRPPTLTSSTCSRTRSQPRSLLSIARLNKARLRARRSTWSRTRIDHTSLGFRGRFCPIRRPLFQGSRRGTDGRLLSSMMVSSEPTARPQDSHGDGRDWKFEGWTFETAEHGGAEPDSMPEAIRATDAEGRWAIYVPLTRGGKIVIPRLPPAEDSAT